MSTVYLNGDYIPASEARVSVDDRGFLFADGIYEVTPAYSGRFFRMEQHLTRLRKGLRELRIDYDPAGLPGIHERLLEENGLTEEEVAYVYLQITRGVAPRSHAFPKEAVPPTVYAFARAFQRPSQEAWEAGFAAARIPDRRWSRVDIKTIALLPNCLALQAAVEVGATDALLIRDGMALEGAHSNFFAVLEGAVVTHPASNVILHGITRGVVLEICRELGIPLELRPIMEEELAVAQEAFFTGTTTEVRPIVRIDGDVVGDGRVGPITRRLSEAFLERVGQAAVGAGSGV